jgi:hypothetical protein
MREKIKIKKILPSVFKQKGFSQGPMAGCLYCNCGENGKGDACCCFGCDMDKESYNLVIKNRELVEEKIKRKIETCFESGEKVDKEFMDGSCYRTKTRKEDGFCVFHSIGKKGCALVELVLEKKSDWKLVPTICKLYPINWAKGVLGLYNETGGDGIETNCDIFRKGKKSDKSLFQTQKEFIDECFEIEVVKSK